MPYMSERLENLKKYYGKILKNTGSLKTGACCCTDEGLPPAVRDIIGEIDGEILDRFYGCASPIPPLLEGCSVLDLGCGTGRDVYIASRLVGSEGQVIGVDMTDEQLEVGKRHLASQMKKFGYTKPNVEFRKGYIEELDEAGVGDESVDVVMSNCVVNLSPDKRRVFSEIFRVLKPGGELYFSDVFAGRRVPEALHDDPVLHGECLSGALYLEDFRRILEEVGCRDYRVASHRPIALDNPEIVEKIGMVDFYSMTIRAFKLPALEDLSEDYGQVAAYFGTIPEHPKCFDLDEQHRFEAGKPVLVCGNTAAMLQETRYAPHFQITGDRSVHYGPFEGGPDAGMMDGPGDSGGSCC